MSLKTPFSRTFNHSILELFQTYQTFSHYYNIFLIIVTWIILFSMKQVFHFCKWYESRYSRTEKYALQSYFLNVFQCLSHSTFITNDHAMKNLLLIIKYIVLSLWEADFTLLNDLFRDLRNKKCYFSHIL